jgi:hypothetical protein
MNTWMRCALFAAGKRPGILKRSCKEDRVFNDLPGSCQGITEMFPSVDRADPGKANGTRFGVIRMKRI